jgi:hypothetical protein
MSTNVAFANFGELFAGGSSAKSDKLGAWQKLAPSLEAGAILVAPVSPANLERREDVLLPQPARILIPRRLSASVCADILRDDDALDDLVTALTRDGEVEIAFQVYSRHLEKLLRTLEERGVRLGDSRPTLSARTVHLWNTKVGGQMLLAGIPDAASLRPPATPVHTVRELQTLLDGLDPGADVVVKLNASIGGAGTVVLRRGSDAQAELTTTASVEPQLKKSWFASREGNGSWPRLVELMVGSLEENQSITSDFVVAGEDRTTFVGLAEQLLAAGLAYRGCRYDRSLFAPEHVSRIAETGFAVGNVMSRRGYRGPFNLDFVVTPENKLFLVEINVRQSAPNDQLRLADRLRAAHGHELSFVCEEDVSLAEPFESTLALSDYLAPLLADSEPGRAYVLNIYGDERQRFACVMSVGETLDEAEGVQRSVRRHLAVAA